MNLLNLLEQNSELEIFQNIDLANYSTIKLRTIGNLLLIKSVECLKNTLQILNENSIKYNPLGLGANQILCNDCNLVLIKLKLPFAKNYLAKKRDIYHLPASVPLSLLTAHARKFDLKGWEYITGIPGTVGGAAYMNAGINVGEFGELVKTVYLITRDGREKVIEIEQGSYSYRKNHFVGEGEIIYAVDIIGEAIDSSVSSKIESYFQERDKSQPWKEKTCGCVFKNVSKTCRAGHCIDILNLKGLTYGGMQISHKHGNFFINKGEASVDDFMLLLSIVREELYLQFGRKFELEIKVLR